MPLLETGKSFKNEIVEMWYIGDVSFCNICPFCNI
jgi:hypothetical protein